MLKERRVLLITVIICLLLVLGVTLPIWSNGGKRGKTIEEKIQEHYSEPIDFSERPGREPTKDTVPEGVLEAKLEIDHPPKIDETAHLTFTITSHWDFPKVRIVISMWREQSVNQEAGIKVVSGLEEFEMSKGKHSSSYIYTYFCPLMNGESKIFEFDIKVTSKGIKQIGGAVGRAHQIIWYRPVCADDGFYLDVGDTVTRISKKPFPPAPEYWVTPLVQGSGPFWGVERMLEDMEKFMKEAPGLTKWEARWLVDRAEWLGREEFTRVYAKRKEEPPSDLELRRMMIKRLIKKSKIRAKKQRKSLLLVFKEMVSDWKKKRPKKTWGFREDAEIKKTSPEGEDLNKSFPKRDITINVTGYFKYKKHLYNKEDGLLEETIDRPMQKALAVVWQNYGGNHYIIGKGITNNAGHYYLTCTPVDTTQYWHHVWVVVVTTGPSYQFPEAYKIRVQSDTVTQYPEWPTQPWWRDHPSTVINVHSGATADFDTFFFAEWKNGLYPYDEQPLSGAANIYEALLRGYEYVADTVGLSLPLYLGAVEAIWEPEYHPIGSHTSVYVGNDTIKICGVRGKRYPDWNNMDEWDDDVILHEFAHFLMDRFAELHIGGASPMWADSGNMTVWRDVWEEAWAYLFSSIVRHDSFFVNTGFGIPGGIGQGRIIFYYNLENEDDFWYKGCPDSIVGGEGCVDAVAASLWDFWDATNESWPDGRQDRLTTSFKETWDVFDNFDPLPPQRNEHDNCWNIREFWGDGFLSDTIMHLGSKKSFNIMGLLE